MSDVQLCFTEKQLRDAAYKFVKDGFAVKPSELGEEGRKLYYVELGTLTEFITTLIEDHASKFLHE